MKSLNEIGINRNFEIFAKHWMASSSFSKKMALDELMPYLIERDRIIKNAAVEAETVIRIFSSQLLQGFYFAAFIAVFFLNF